MIYNFNLGIGWASSGVEYAQSYRAMVLRNIHQPAKFIFSDMFPRDNLIDMTRNIGFKDDEIIWLYTFFTDYVPESVTYTLKDLMKTISTSEYRVEREGMIGRINLGGGNNYYRVYFNNRNEDFVHRVEIVERGCLIRKDYFMSGRVFSEYYAPLDNSAHLYQRRFFNRDGSVAYDEIIDDERVMYKFPDKIICSKEELIGYLTRSLKPTENDIIIIDRSTGQAQAILENAGDARVGIVIHADHFNDGSTDETKILWNNYYEYAFAMNRHIDFYITATNAQKRILTEQFEKYLNASPNVYTIPVGSLSGLIYPIQPRKKHSFITASRLATEKHVDWLIAAVAEARKSVTDISLYIYGKGGEADSLQEMIDRLGASDYIRLMGQHDMKNIYVNYAGYLSASTSEGFGLTLMEAVGSGLPIIGFDVRYGNQTFIDDGQNGYRVPYAQGMERRRRQQKLIDAIVRLCTEDDIEAFSRHSYDKARYYLTEEVEKKWMLLIDEVLNRK